MTITPQMQALADELAHLTEADVRCVRILWKEVGHDELDGEPRYRMALDEEGVGRDGMLVVSRKESDGKTYAMRQPFGLDLLDDMGPSAMAFHFSLAAEESFGRAVAARATGEGEG